MSDIRIVDSIENWFDVLVVLADDRGGLSPQVSGLVAEFAGRRAVYLVIPDGPDGPCRSDRAAPGVLWRVHCPAGDTPEQAASLWRFLRDTKVRRPLIWVEHPAYSHFLETAAEAFKVFHGVAPSAAPAKGLKDKVLGLIGKGAPPAPTGPAVTAEDCDAVVVADAAGAPREYRGAVVVWGQGGLYEDLDRALCEAVTAKLREAKNLNILVLYDDTFTHIKPIQEHLQAFSKHSRHNYFYFPVRTDKALFEPYEDTWPKAWDFEMFDAVIWHYCLRAAHEDNIDPAVSRRLAEYSGLKILFIQDDYDTTLTTWKWIEAVGIQLVMTCIPAYGIAYAFPDWKPGVVEFLQTHTGFVPEDDMDRFAVPMESRKLHLAYRGRSLPYRYGSLGREKYLIGTQMKALADAAGVPADIEVDDASRIYGDDWYRFTVSARATLASETGSHVFDFDSSISALSGEAEAAGVSYDDFYAEHLADKEQHVRMNQVSPRIFEAVRLRTALVCFEGDYSGAIEANTHYIPLKKDFSNADEVFEKLRDVEALKAMTERAYRDVIESDLWSHAAFVRRFDGIVGSRVMRPARTEFLSAPVARRRRGAASFETIARMEPIEYMLNSGVLRGGLRRPQFAQAIDKMREAEFSPELAEALFPPAHARCIGVIRPFDLETTSYWAEAGAHSTRVEGGLRITTPADPGHYTTYALIDLSAVWFEDEFCWIQVTLDDIVGDLGVCLFNPNENEVYFEQVVSGRGPQEVLLRIDRAAGPWLMIRTGNRPGPAQATFVEARILTAFRYKSKVVDAMFRLAKHPAFRAPEA